MIDVKMDVSNDFQQINLSEKQLHITGYFQVFIHAFARILLRHLPM